MYRTVDEAAAAASHEKRKRRGTRRRGVRTRNRKPAQRKSSRGNARQVPQQTRPSAPPLLFKGDNFDNKLPVLGSLVPEIVKPLLRPLQPIFNVFRPSTPTNSDDEEPPVPPRSESLAVGVVPEATRAPPPVPRRMNAPEPDENTYGKRKKRPRRKSLMISRGKKLAQMTAEALAAQPEEAKRGLTAQEVIDLAEMQSFEWEDPFGLFGFKNKTLAAVRYLQDKGLDVEVGESGWDISVGDGYDTDASTWDDEYYGPKLRF